MAEAGPGWASKLWGDIKGNAKWDAMKFLGSVAVAAAYFLLQKMRHLELDWWVAGGLFVASVALFFYAGRANRKNTQLQGSPPNTAANAVSITGQPFDAPAFFRLSYYSPLQPEVETNMRDAAIKNQPHNREAFYLKLISLGVVAYSYDTIWYNIYASQLMALLDLNKNSGLLPLARVKTHYDQAAAAYPTEYKSTATTLDTWLSFLISYGLIIRHPSEMIEITVRGKDFLKYLLHWGREANQRRF